jgi:RNA polymerase sigma-70 factor (ECF subfamily)
MASRPPEIKIPVPFEEALRRHEREIMRFLLRTTRDREDALDLFQETWLRAYRAYPRLDPDSSLRPWLFRIASNLCRNRLRELVRRGRVFADGDCPDREPRRDADGGGTAEFDLRRAIAALPARQGQAFAMRKFVGLEYREIAEALGCSEESARANVYQAVKKLKSLR